MSKKIIKESTGIELPTSCAKSRRDNYRERHHMYLKGWTLNGVQGSARPLTVDSTRASMTRQDSSTTLGGDSANAAVQTTAQVTQVAPTGW